MSEKSNELRGIIRRVSHIIEDVEATACFYESLFGWTRFYDNKTPVDGRFPPCAPDKTMGHIVILKADDPDIGMLGFMEYQGFKPAAKIDKNQNELGIGSAILVVESKDIVDVHSRAVALGARVVTTPIDWSVTDYTGKGVIELATFSFFDMNGFYVEVNTRKN